MGDVMFTGGEEGECRLAQVKGGLQEKEKLCNLAEIDFEVYRLLQAD